MSFQRLAAVCVFVPGLALAADLGRLTVQSGAGEPMRVCVTRDAHYLARLVFAAGASLAPDSACMPWAMPISTPLASAA